MTEVEIALLSGCNLAEVQASARADAPLREECEAPRHLRVRRAPERDEPPAEG
jgi:hypothetical protein